MQGFTFKYIIGTLAIGTYRYRNVILQSTFYHYVYINTAAQTILLLLCCYKLESSLAMCNIQEVVHVDDEKVMICTGTLQ